MESVFNYVKDHYGALSLILFLVSELLGEIPAVRANSIFGFFRGILLSETKKTLPDFENQMAKKWDK